MEEKSIELEGTRARLRQLEKSSTESRKFHPAEPSKLATTTHPASAAVKSAAAPEPATVKPSEKPAEPWRAPPPTKAAEGRRSSVGGRPPPPSEPVDLASRLTAENYVKYPLTGGSGEPRVTFDLGPKKAKITEVPTPKRVVTIDRPAGERPGGSQLPSDARQRLQELAGPDHIKRNYRKSSGDAAAAPQVRPSRLNLSNGGKYIVSPPRTPPTTESPTAAASAIKRSSLTRRDSRSTAVLQQHQQQQQQLNSAKNSLIMNFANNNVKPPNKLSRDSPVTRGGGSTGNRTRTPSVERSITSKDDLKDPSKVRGKSFWGGWWKFS